MILSFPANYNGQIGHVVAPEADFYNSTGDYNGCLIVNSLTGTAEGHMWPYKGKFLEGGLKLRLGKTLDGKAPDGRKFQFRIQKMTETDADPDVTVQDIELKEGDVLETVYNNNQEIAFGALKFKKAGDYYYRIYEELDPSDETCRYDTGCFYIKVETEETKDKIKVTSVNYWKADITDKNVAGDPEEADLSNGNMEVDLSGKAVFENTTKSAASIRFKAGKQVDGADPDGEQKFNFILQPMRITTDNETPEITLTDEGTEIKLIADGSIPPDKKQNENSVITFESIEYQAPGTYYYQVYEQPGTEQPENLKDAYIFDETRYYIRVLVEEKDGRTEVASAAYWKAENGSLKKIQVIKLPGEVIDLTSEMKFNNKTKATVVLPETGNVGTGRFSNTGFWLLLIGALGILVCEPHKRRRSRRI